MLCAAFISVVLVSIFFFHVWNQEGGRVRLDQLHLFLDAYKAIGVAFLVAFLGVVVPHLLPEARDQFERFKDSRIAYSRAKTSVIYLPERLASLAFSESVAAVHDSHEKLHLAETYASELQRHLAWHPHPDTWVDRNYWELFAMRRVLDLNVDNWPTLTPGQRLKGLQNALKVVEDSFGAANELWFKLPRPERERQIEKSLDTKVLPVGTREGEKGNTA
jgi:hypothetical protein